MASTVLTLALDEESQAHFESLRQRYYPAALNRIPAHLTLFHRLPAAENAGVVLDETAGATEAFAMEVIGLMSMGRGVAYRLRSEAALELHRRLSLAFATELTRQDRQSFRPHVVVQNKASGEEARALMAALEAQFIPWTVRAAGMDWWDYLGGPWQLRRRFLFTNGRAGCAAIRLNS